MFQRYSKQREAVYNLLSATDTHPTADWIYAEAKKVIPDISIATVYRNLRELVRNGMAKVVMTGDDKEHFDADVRSHPHFVCRRCGKVIDVETVGETKLAAAGHEVTGCDTTFFGICAECTKKGGNHHG